MDHMWKMLGLAKETDSSPAAAPALPEKGVSDSAMSQAEDAAENEQLEDDFLQRKTSHQTTKEAREDAKETSNAQDVDRDDKSTASSLSFYTDFPDLYFAVRKGRFKDNCIYQSWDAAKTNILGYAEAEWIATPTVRQARQYICNLGHCHIGRVMNEIREDQAQVGAQALESTPERQPKPKLSTRKLVLEFYQLHDPFYKQKGTEKYTLEKFLKERQAEDKFQRVQKHWGMSGLLVACQEKMPFLQAVDKYDDWARERQQEGKKRKLSQPVAVISGEPNPSPDSDRKKPRRSPDGNKTSKPPSKKQRKRSSPASTKKNSAQKKKNTKRSAVPKRAAVPTAKPLYNRGEDDDDVDDDNDEAFNRMYEKLKAFHSKHGHCNVKQSQDKKLHSFVTYTKRRMKVERDRAGARALTLREEKLLNDLDFDPKYKEIVTEFNKYLGMRIAKHFDVQVDENDLDEGASRIKTDLFFGTVGRISSYSDRFLRIEYDDGDSEDFDMKMLRAGLALYEEFKDEDPRPVLGKTAEKQNVDNGEKTQTNRSETAVTSAENDGDDDGDDENEIAESNDNEDNDDAKSTSSDEVEIVGVAVPYRGNPSLLGFGNDEEDDENNENNGNNPFSIYTEGFYEF